MQSARGETRTEELSPAQRAVVRRSAEARATVPDLELDIEVDMARTLAMRAQGRGSLTGMLVRAAAVALREVPRANAAYRDGRFELYSRINVGVVVFDGPALVVPTVLDADRKSLRELSEEIAALRRDARDEALTSASFAGATFTLANAGALGVSRYTMIPNAPHAAALAAGAIRGVGVVREGAVVPGHAMTLTLACDHRILYGQEAARFLVRMKSALEGGEL